ncbi:hypothetical protein CAEBREN_23863 [Caenorhabditis brenneri]|uniref:Uncharacterized protein n=1 Tax=Caenorhabditis brenneri TaxID=135651 RepID=G0N331_CAEBE|nr:hypothetical protein CAEBREN_23863 [Caenorhabditis brenneri]
MDVFPSTATLLIGGAVFAVGAVFGAYLTDTTLDGMKKPDRFYDMLMAMDEKEPRPKCRDDYDEEEGDNDFLIEERSILLP